MSELEQEADKLVEDLKPFVEQRRSTRERISHGLADNGRQLKRNAICPCGSGKKFKKCHLKALKAKVATESRYLLTTKMHKARERCKQLSK